MAAPRLLMVAMRSSAACTMAHLRVGVLTSGPTNRRTQWNLVDGLYAKPSSAAVAARPGWPDQTHDIFEGTEQIQQLVISRAISGIRIE